MPAAEHVTFETKCAKTECEARVDATPALTPACKSCIGVWADACADDPLCPDAEQSCRTECATEKCYGASPCLEYSWTAQLEHPVATPGVEAACQAAYADESTRCGFQPNADDIIRINAECTKAALTNTDAGVAYYAAFEAFECGEVPSDKLSAFGAELCAMPAGVCLSSCSDPNHGGLDALGSRLKPDVLDGARTCMSETSCDEVNRCMDAWRTLIF
jgi:hypothetical protein